MTTLPREWESPVAQIERQSEALIEMAQSLKHAGVLIAPVDSKWSVSGLLNHQRYVLRFWVGNVVVGLDEEMPWTDDNPDADWSVRVDTTTEELCNGLRAEVKRVRELLSRRSVDDPAALADNDGTRPAVTWVLSHLVAELARHAGQLDIVCELSLPAPGRDRA